MSGGGHSWLQLCLKPTEIASGRLLRILTFNRARWYSLQAQIKHMLSVLCDKALSLTMSLHRGHASITIAVEVHILAGISRAPVLP